MDCDWTWDKKHSARPCPFTSCMLHSAILGSKAWSTRHSGPVLSMVLMADTVSAFLASLCMGGKEPHGCHGGPD